MQLPLRIRAFLFFNQKLQDLIFKERILESVRPPQRTVVPDPEGPETLEASTPCGDHCRHHWGLAGDRFRTLTLPLCLGPCRDLLQTLTEEGAAPLGAEPLHFPGRGLPVRADAQRPAELACSVQNGRPGAGAAQPPGAQRRGRHGLAAVPAQRRPVPCPQAGRGCQPPPGLGRPRAARSCPHRRREEGRGGVFFMEDVDGRPRPRAAASTPRRRGRAERRGSPRRLGQREDSGQQQQRRGRRAPRAAAPTASCPCLDSRRSLDGWEAGAGTPRQPS